MSSSIPMAEFKEIAKRAMLAGVTKALGLRRRVPEFMQKRGWPHRDEDLAAVLGIAVALRKMGAGGTIIRRPSGAERCGGLWPVTSLLVTASQVVDTLELDDLLDAI